MTTGTPPSITSTNEHQVLVIRCTHIQQSQDRDRRCSLSIEPTLLFPSSVDMRGTSPALLTSRWRCSVTQSWLFERKVHISVGMLDFPSEQTMPGFEFIHCISLNATDEAGARVFRVSDHDGSKGSRSSKPFMKGGDCRCEYPIL